MAFPLAADYPFMDVLWSMLIFFGFFMWIWLAIMMFADVFRRRDMGGFAKALWIVLAIILPWFGVLIYLVVYHRGIAERSAGEAAAAQAAFDERVREVAGSGAGGAAQEIEAAQRLLDSGAITADEFNQMKARALAGRS